MPVETIKFIDLFAGIGGIRLGFEQAIKEIGLKAECVFSSEIDKKACETYRLNFGETPSGDIKQCSDSIPPFDFMLAGFPCQPFSYAGKKMGFGDTRGTLFFEIEKILSTHQPRGFLLENVRGLTTHDGGRTLATILKHLQDLGYSTTYILCNSSNFNIPQNRVRIYILGILNSDLKISVKSDKGTADSHTYKKDIPKYLLSNCRNYPTVNSILEESSNPKYYCSTQFVKLIRNVIGDDFTKLHGVRLIDYRGGNSLHSWDLGIKGKCSLDERQFMNALISNRRKKIFGVHQDGKCLTIEQIKTFFNHPELERITNSLISKGYLRKVDEKYNPVCGNMSFEIFKFLDPNSISITLTSSDAHKLGVVQNGIVRKITPRECARLQGFPDSFILHPNDTAAYKQLGNAVTVPVISAVIIDMFKNNYNPLVKLGVKAEYSLSKIG
jgi:DNA (cytosine-5)-methyltransferase 1